MKYCVDCAAPLELKIPDGDDRERYCCNQCGLVHYINPKIIVGCIPVWEDRIMMCKRGIEPRLGYWTLPGGFMEVNETTEQGAMRETWEESRAEVEIQRLHGIYNIPRINQVYFFYLAKMTSPHFELTPESTDIRLYSTDEIPWDNLAFTVVDLALKQYISGEGKINEPYFNSLIK